MLGPTVVFMSPTVVAVVSQPRFALVPQMFLSLMLQAAFPLVAEIFATITIVVAIRNALRRVMLALMIAS